MTKAKSSARVTTRQSFAALIAAEQKAATAAHATHSARERAERLHPVAQVQIVGGRNDAYTLKINDRATHFPARTWHYRSHEEIDDAMRRELLHVTTAAARRDIEAKRKSLHADLNRAEKAADRRISPVVRKARAADEAAQQAHNLASNKLLDYKPKTGAEALEMIAYLTTKDCIVVVDGEIRTMLRNALAIIGTQPTKS